MSNELIPASEAQNKVVSYAEVAKASTYLARIQLMTSNSELCKAGEFPVNHFAYIADGDPQDLGTSIDVLVCAWRAKALDTSNEDIIESLDPNSTLYQEIQSRAGGANSGCMFGPEYLVWIPEIGKFATIFYGSKSGRRESKSIHSLLRCAATLSPKKIETAKYTWFVATADECTGLDPLPDMEELKKQTDDFITPPVGDDAVQADDSQAAERAQ